MTTKQNILMWAIISAFITAAAWGFYQWQKPEPLNLPEFQLPDRSEEATSRNPNASEDDSTIETESASQDQPAMISRTAPAITNIAITTPHFERIDKYATYVLLDKGGDSIKYNSAPQGMSRIQSNGKDIDISPDDNGYNLMDIFIWASPGWDKKPLTETQVLYIETFSNLRADEPDGQLWYGPFEGKLGELVM